MGTEKKKDEMMVVKAELAKLTEKVSGLFATVKEVQQISKEMSRDLEHKQ